MTFPETLGPFHLWPPDPTRGTTGWGISCNQIWLPVILADRDACLLVAGMVLAGMDDGPLIALRDEHNRARPSQEVTVRHLLDKLDPGWDHTDEDDEEQS